MSKRKRYFYDNFSHLPEWGGYVVFDTFNRPCGPYRHVCTCPSGGMAKRVRTALNALDNRKQAKKNPDHIIETWERWRRSRS